MDDDTDIEARLRAASDAWHAPDTVTEREGLSARAYGVLAGLGILAIFAGLAALAIASRGGAW